MTDPLFIAVLLLAAWALIVTGFYILDKRAAKVTPPAEKKKSEPEFDLNERFNNLTNEIRSLERRINDVDEASEARYRKISIRHKRTEQRVEAEEELQRFTQQQAEAKQVNMFPSNGSKRLIKR